MSEFALFASTASLVFFLGMQQLNVQGNHHILAALTSFLIGGAQIYLWRAMPDATNSEIAATLLGGPVGILLAMWAHPRMVRIINWEKS